MKRSSITHDMEKHLYEEDWIGLVFPSLEERGLNGEIIKLYRRTRGCWAGSQNRKEVLHAAVADQLKFGGLCECRKFTWIQGTYWVSPYMWDWRLLVRKKTYCPYEIPRVKNSWWVGEYWEREVLHQLVLFRPFLEYTHGSSESALLLLDV